MLRGLLSFDFAKIFLEIGITKYPWDSGSCDLLRRYLRRCPWYPWMVWSYGCVERHAEELTLCAGIDRCDRNLWTAGLKDDHCGVIKPERIAKNAWKGVFYIKPCSADLSYLLWVINDYQNWKYWTYHSCQLLKHILSGCFIDKFLKNNVM